MKLNPMVIWNIKANGGVGSFNLDLSKFKVKTFNFDGGASKLNVKFSDLVSESHIDINAGVAAIEIKVPENVGCQIEVEGALTSNTFNGFKKVNSKQYKTSNFDTAKAKIYIHFNGELSSLKVSRY